MARRALPPTTAWSSAGDATAPVIGFESKENAAGGHYPQLDITLVNSGSPGAKGDPGDPGRVSAEWPSGVRQVQQVTRGRPEWRALKVIRVRQVPLDPKARR